MSCMYPYNIILTSCHTQYKFTSCHTHKIYILTRCHTQDTYTQDGNRVKSIFFTNSLKNSSATLTNRHSLRL